MKPQCGQKINKIKKKKKKRKEMHQWWPTHDFLVGSTQVLTVIPWTEKGFPRRGQLFSLWITVGKFHSRAGKSGVNVWPRFPAWRPEWFWQWRTSYPCLVGEAERGQQLAWKESGLDLDLCCYWELFSCVVFSLCYPQIFYMSPTKW